ncbi:MAG TPA: glycosyltransferase family 39 protein [Candidatus Polarisedimenticolia bacterium]|nr:glycosyltransferase family 39 protein [Candidatus Polarisedimenticolia bacterium]
MTSEGARHPGARRAAVPAALVALSLLLNTLGITWGQPAGADWDFDSIAGMQSVKEARYLFGEWRHKYPPVHFALNAVLYAPLLTHWFGSPARAPLADGRVLADPELARRFGILIVLSRALSAAMGAAAVLAVYLTALLLLRDRRAALFAGLSLALCQMFVFYSHLGNLDVPAAFWFSWAMHAAARVVVRQRLGDFVLAGLFCALATGTKDAALGFAVGLAAAVAVGLGRQAAPWRPWRRGSFVTGFSLQVMAGLAVFCAALALANAPSGGWEPFARRLGHWMEGPGTVEYNLGFAGQPGLLEKASRDMYVSLGWPLAAAAAVSIPWAAARAPAAAAFGVLPTLAFYLVVVMNARLVAPRFFVPGFVSLAVVIGAGLAAWSRWRTIPRAARAAVPAAVFGLSALYCLALDLEMLHDTRYRAEAWFREHARPGALVATLAPATLAPRLQFMGFRHEWRYGRPTRRGLLERGGRPDYLVLSEKYFTNPALFEPSFLRGLLEGKEGYALRATLRKEHLPPAPGLLGLAGRPRPWLDQVSPTLYILESSSSIQASH